jgi:hypothetical protein
LPDLVAELCQWIDAGIVDFLVVDDAASHATWMERILAARGANGSGRSIRIPVIHFDDPEGGFSVGGVDSAGDARAPVPDGRIRVFRNWSREV